jgi:PAS domain S-box-containing protein
MDTLSFYLYLLQNDPNPLLFLNNNLEIEFANNQANDILKSGSLDPDSQLINLFRKQWKEDLSETVVTVPTSKGDRTFRISIKKLVDGEINLGFLLGFSDLTNHIKDQQRLIESQKNYGNIFMNSYLRMLVIDSNSFEIKDINKTALEFYGYYQSEIIGKNFLSINTLQRDQMISEIQKAKTNKKGRFFSNQILANGSSVDVEIFMGPLSFMENANLYVVVNPTFEKQDVPGSDQLDLDTRFLNLINNINESILIQNVSHDPSQERFITVNDRATSFLGFSKRELLQMNPRQLVSNDSEKKEMDNFFRTLLEKKRLQFDIDLTDKNQHVIHAEFNSCLNESGLQKQIISVVRDVSNQKKIDEVKDEFVNTITHELRTPIAALKGSLYLLKEKGQDHLTEVIEIADRNVERLLSLVNDILDYQKLSMDRLSFHLIEQQINDLVILIGEEIKGQLLQKDLKIFLNLDPELKPLFFDRNRITQVLMNLTHNAIKFTNNGSLTLITTQDEDNVIVRVKDTGIGIKKEEINQLFLPFAQLTDGIDKKGSSGLGLAICKKIINSIGGIIWVESEYGKGSTFSISIPKKSIFKVYKKT